MNQILMFIGLIVVALIVLKLMAALASFVLRIGFLLVLVIVGYVLWQSMQH
jgi:hypothetical protein